MNRSLPMTVMNKLDEFYKFGTAEPDQRPRDMRKVFSREVKDGAAELCIAAGVDLVALIETLLEEMPEPFWLLYVLVVSRGEGREGRYQSSEPVTLEEAKAFLDRFRHFVEKDGRHNIWFKSESGPALIVCDRHDLVFCYGLADTWVPILRKRGWSQVEKNEMASPDPHAHHYHAIFDDDARDVLAYMEWQHSPLREQDY
jgi:hypothetical protein